jgi:DDE family transposase
MERELWPRLYHLIMKAGESLRLTDVTFQPHIIVLVLFWAALHDRPVCWACNEENWSTTTLRPARIPSESTLSRRLRRMDTAMFLRLVVQQIRETGDPGLIAVIDGKPLPVGGASQDPEAHCGRGAARLAKGYKLYAVYDGRPIAAAYRVYSMNRNEDKVAEDMIPDLTGGGYLLGDGEYDANAVFDTAGAAGYQLLAPREHPEAGLGHHYQSPYRLRCIDLMRTSFGEEVYRLRGSIERDFGHLTSFGCGLSPLPAWVRHEKRVWLWVTAKGIVPKRADYAIFKLTLGKIQPVPS